MVVYFKITITWRSVYMFKTWLKRFIRSAIKSILEVFWQDQVEKTFFNAVLWFMYAQMNEFVYWYLFVLIFLGVELCVWYNIVYNTSYWNIYILYPVYLPQRHCRRTHPGNYEQLDVLLGAIVCLPWKFNYTCIINYCEPLMSTFKLLSWDVGANTVRSKFIHKVAPATKDCVNSKSQPSTCNTLK